SVLPAAGKTPRDGARGPHRKAPGQNASSDVGPADVFPATVPARDRRRVAPTPRLNLARENAPMTRQPDTRRPRSRQRQGGRLPAEHTECTEPNPNTRRLPANRRESFKCSACWFGFASIHIVRGQP